MKRLFRLIRRLLLAAAVLAVLALILKDSILRVLLERRIRSETGMDAEIGSFSSSLLSPVVTIKNFRLYNTAAFGGTPFLDIPELHIEFDPAALARHKVHITLMRLNLAELDVVRNQEGQTNIVNLLNEVHPPASLSRQARQPARDFQFTGIDVLNLSLGKTKFIDLKNFRNNREVRLNLRNQVFKNLDSKSDVYGMLFVLWLRSGGRLSITPTGLAHHFLHDHFEEMKGIVHEGWKKTTAPFRKH